jgi:hypothetical protein
MRSPCGTTGRGLVVNPYIQALIGQNDFLLVSPANCDKSEFSLGAAHCRPGRRSNQRQSERKVASLVFQPTIRDVLACRSQVCKFAQFLPKKVHLPDCWVFKGVYPCAWRVKIGRSQPIKNANNKISLAN